MHGIGRFISEGDCIGLVEDAGYTCLKTIPFEKSHRASFVLAEADVGVDLGSDPVCNDMRGLHRLWLRAGEKLGDTEACEPRGQGPGSFFAGIAQNPAS